MGGGWSGRWREEGWETGSSIQKISSLSLNPRNSGSLGGGQAQVGWLLIQSRAPAPVTTTAAPAAEPRVPHACPPGTAPPQPNLSTWLTLPSRGFQGRGKGSPRTYFFFSLTELPPSSVFCYKIQNSGPILTTYFWGHKSISPLFCFSKKIIILKLASRLPNFSSYFSLVCIFKARIQRAHVEFLLPKWKLVLPGGFGEFAIFPVWCGPAFANDERENNPIWENEMVRFIKTS